MRTKEKPRRTIEELAKIGEGHDVIDALNLLTVAYMDMCGISISYRTALFCAGEAWQEKLAWMDLPLSDAARKHGLSDFMPIINSEYDPEIYDDYDIAGMTEEELLDCCRQIVAEQCFSDSTIEVLCWGLLKCINRKDPSEELVATAQDGTQLTSDYHSRHCGGTFLAMKAPFEFRVYKDELVRDLKGLMIEAYEAYLRLYAREKEIRKLYPIYQERFAQCKERSRLKKHAVFQDVYKAIISDSIIMDTSMVALFNKWWGLEFFNKII